MSTAFMSILWKSLTLRLDMVNTIPSLCRLLRTVRARDGKIHITGLNSPGTPNGSPVSWTERSKAVTCLASSADGCLLVSGSGDGIIRVWDTGTRNIIRVFLDTQKRQGSSVASEVELGRLKSEQARSVQMNQRWQRLCKELHQFCI